MKSFILLSASLCLALAVPSAHADGLRGSTVYADISLYGPNQDKEKLKDFKPDHTKVLNDTTEFSVTSEVQDVKVKKVDYSFTDTYTVNVSAFGLTVNVECTAVSVNNPCAEDPYNPVLITLTDAAFADGTFSILQDPGNLFRVNAPGIRPASLPVFSAGILPPQLPPQDEIDILFVGGSDPTGKFKLGAAFPAAATPEPSSLMLLGTGMLGLAFFARRRAII